MAIPGFRPVQRDLVIEVQNDDPTYHFWLLSDRGIEPLPLTRDQPYTVDGSDRHGSHRIAHVIAAPAGVIERLIAEVGEAKAREELMGVNALPGLLRSETIDFRDDVPFYDSRERVIDRYQLVIDPPDRVRMEWLGQNIGDRRVKVAWAVAGICATVAIIGTGWWVLRRAWRVVRKVAGRTGPRP